MFDVNRTMRDEGEDRFNVQKIFIHSFFIFPGMDWKSKENNLMESDLNSSDTIIGWMGNEMVRKQPKKPLPFFSK